MNTVLLFVRECGRGCGGKGEGVQSSGRRQFSSVQLGGSHSCKVLKTGDLNVTMYCSARQQGCLEPQFCLFVKFKFLLCYNCFHNAVEV